MKYKLITKILSILTLTFFSLTIKSQTKKDKEFSKVFYEQFTKKLNDTIPSIGSFIVSKNDKVIYEQYFHGANRETIFDVKSVTKSITSILAGIAKDKGLISDLNTPVLQILPEYDISRSQFKNIYDIEGKRELDSIRKTVTLKHLLTMRGGFKWKENGGEIAVAQFFSSDPVRFVLDLPFEEYPGDKFNYSTGETQVFGASLSRIVKTSLKDFADKNLFGSLSLNIERWDTDVLDRNLAGSELFMKPTDMLKFGNLVLNNEKMGTNKLYLKNGFMKQPQNK